MTELVGHRQLSSLEPRARSLHAIVRRLQQLGEQDVDVLLWATVIACWPTVTEDA